ncbi:HAD family phosphatase [Microbacterium esteraromaticum]|uniref:HAD family phosphatase n=1 Tax=Microbacterium esteraromaticum TaxID=57043 RepID=A0A939DYM1_9MICO|nr:HAD family phosphatase [Microbacterium esteraromaticum]MBN8416889.1 HAD family phosphatase [Microbacterium esteraromaticum]MBN8425516.1 HAD family phosphatase [Microbacterium esteraromaticum]
MNIAPASLIADTPQRPAPGVLSSRLAVLCDMDGTLLDTEATWLDTVRAVFYAFGVTPAEDAVASLEGATTEQASTRIAALIGEEVAKPSAVAAQLETRSLTAMEGNIRWRPGAEELLRSLHDAGVPLVLVTSSTRRWVDAVASQVDFSLFTHTISADDVALAKPHPEPYLRAAELLGRAPSECVVFEDSAVGLQAALAAGCTSVLVRADSASWTADAHESVPDLRGADAAWVRAVAQRNTHASTP